MLPGLSSNIASPSPSLPISANMPSITLSGLSSLRPTISTPVFPISVLSSVRPSTTLRPSSIRTSLPPGVPTPTSLPVFSCPADTGLTYVNPYSQAFLITCSVNYPGSDLISSLQPNLETCLDTCGTVPGCTAAAFDQSTYTCYYKSTVGEGVEALDYEGAAPVDLSCPNANGAFYLDSYGASYQILCNYSFPAGSNLTEVQISKRADLLLDFDYSAQLPAHNLGLFKRDPADAVDMLKCASRCSQTPGCIGVGIVENACTLIGSYEGSIGATSDVSDAIVLVSKRIVTTNAAGEVVTATSTFDAPSVVPSARSPLVINQLGAQNPGGESSSSIGATGTRTASSAPSTGSASVGTIPGSPSSSSTGGSVLSLTTPAASTPASACSRTRFTTVVPVTTVWTTISVASCTTNFLEQTGCPSASLTLSEVGSRTTTLTSRITVRPEPSTFSTLRTVVR